MDTRNDASKLIFLCSSINPDSSGARRLMVHAMVVKTETL
ncbi:hypothetical protein SAMN04489724_1335 [Algoriphagus locisalis]|uniref:Uncharacterized protein n=1 Tax=Algoriphagus locisalis TaxID=305507 RepID=A0A1I6Z005_9BACT|nr:hypothetical protein SAMN04489724_1335 [Algoriphagus locisalis]